MVVFGLGKNLLFKSILGHCANQAQALLPKLYCSVLWRPLAWNENNFLSSKIPRQKIYCLLRIQVLIFNDWKLWKYFGVKLHNFGTVASDQAFTHDDMLNQTIFMPDWKQNSYILCNCICVSMTTIAQPTVQSYTANVCRELQGLYREIGVQGFQIYGDCMYTRNPCNFEISTLLFPL